MAVQEWSLESGERVVTTPQREYADLKIGLNEPLIDAERRSKGVEKCSLGPIFSDAGLKNQHFFRLAFFTEA